MLLKGYFLSSLQLPALQWAIKIIIHDDHLHLQSFQTSPLRVHRKAIVHLSTKPILVISTGITHMLARMSAKKLTSLWLIKTQVYLLSPTLRQPLLWAPRPAIMTLSLFELLSCLKTAHTHTTSQNINHFFLKDTGSTNHLHILWVSSCLFFQSHCLHSLSSVNTQPIPTLSNAAGLFYEDVGNSSLHFHLESVQKNGYLQLCEANKWTIMLLKMRKNMESAISDNQFGGSGTPCPPFLQSKLLKVMVNFVVADDQVQSMLHQYYAANYIKF